MKNVLLMCLLLCASPLGAQQSQECTVLVAKEWISMGAASLNGCLRFADEAATPGERQFAKFGAVHLKVQGLEHFLSADGGNTWEPIVAQSAQASFGSLNVLQPSDGPVVSPSTPPEVSAHRAPVKKKRRRRRR